MIFMTVLRTNSSAILPKERHEQQPEHVERGDERGNEADQPENPVRFVCLPQNFILAEESGKWRNPSDRNGCDGHRRESPRDVLSQAAHLTHVLPTTDRMDHRTSSKEQQA